MLFDPVLLHFGACQVCAWKAIRVESKTAAMHDLGVQAG